MITKGYDTNKKPQCIIVKVATMQSTRVRCRIYHAIKVINQYVEGRPYTDYFNHVQNIRGNGIFYCRMPQAPKHVLIEISDANNGQTKINTGNIKLIPFDSKSWIGSVPLKTNIFNFNYKDKKIQEAINHFQWLSEHLSVLSSGGSVYGSVPTYYIRVDMHDHLINRQTRQLEEGSPARIGIETKIIEVSKEVLGKYTVQQRMSVFMHEYGHGYLNSKMADESEADMNAIKILISLGYSRVEIAKVFLSVFDKYQTKDNKNRWLLIKDYIAHYDLKNLSYNDENYYKLNG